MLQRLRLLSPALKALLFTLIPLAYYLLDKLNYSQTGKGALLGFLAFGTLFYWREVAVKRRPLFTLLLTLWLFILLLYMGFQAALRDVFSVQQEDTVVIQSIFSTNAEETREFFIQYYTYILKHLLLFLFFFASYWLLFVRQEQFKRREPGAMKRLVVVASLFTFALLAIHANPTARRYNPLVYFPYNYLKWQGEVAQAAELYEKFDKLQDDPQLNSMQLRQGVERKTLVFVIGESDTRRNWSLYGYGRETNPELAKLRDQLLLFGDVLAGDDGTIKSITKMLTPATLKEPDLWHSKPSFVSIAKRLGYKVIWVTNQGAEWKGIVSLLAAQASQTVFTNQGGSRGEGSTDEVVFAPYEAALDDPAEKKLIVVHILGGHPAYNYRYPEGFGKFEDLYDDPIAQGLSQQGRASWAIAFRNMYDSAILHQDYVLSQLLTRLKSRNDPNAAWLYIPDHGEDVVHHTNFSGHNGKAEEMWEVPMLFWGGANFDWRGLDRATLERRPYQADVIDNTLLGLLDISGDYYDPALDIFSPRYDAQKIVPRQLRGLKYKDQKLASGTQ